ncbi:MAG TPA: hypothetical protein VN253_00680, partial [Kofleriaceae bacterium]|nr:hypothetical protein [Kofleriaceae bacterium]
MRARIFVVVALIWLAAPGTASSFSGREHRAIGAESYIAACDRLAPLKDRDPATASRYALACGNLQVQALIYGQATRVSGDFLADPNDFMTALGVSVVTQSRNYWKLALTNVAHFHPLATREWRSFHDDAIAEALAAVKLQGKAQIEGFEQAFYDSAFGDHFLQDSFAAGHMGFNRPASSAGAAKAYHDEWNERGRWVSNRKGEVWKTYGDGRLDREQAREARKHVIAASTESVYGVLAAFVLGAYDPTVDFAVWREVAFTIEETEILPALEILFGRSTTLARPELLPLLAVKRPALKDGILGAWSVFTLTFEHADDPSGALLFGGDLIVPGLGASAEVGIGVGFNDSFTKPRLAIDAGLVRGIGLSWHGLVSHQLLVDSKKRGNLRRVRGAALRPAHEPYEDQLAFLARRAFLSVSASRR